MFKFIIDTNSYAGNFEREICAYLTGKVGECEVGWELVEIFENENTDSISFNNVCSIISDQDDPCPRPCYIEITPGWFNDGVGNHCKVDNKNPKNIDKFPAYCSVAIFFKTKPSQIQIDLMKARAIKFKENLKILGEYQADRMKGFEIEGFRLIEVETIETEIEI
jgi:hypothetical protein